MRKGLCSFDVRYVYWVSDELGGLRLNDFIRRKLVGRQQGIGGLSCCCEFYRLWKCSFDIVQLKRIVYGCRISINLCGGRFLYIQVAVGVVLLVCVAILSDFGFCTFYVITF